MNGLVFIWGAALVVFSMGAAPVHGANESVQLKLDVTPKSIYIGDVITYRIDVTFGASLQPLPLVVPPSTGAFELRGQSTLPPEDLTGEKRRQTHELRW